MDDTADAAASVRSVLQERFALALSDLTRLPIGQGTVNYRAVCADGEAFVKQYPPGTDLSAERAAIALSELARSHGIPAAPVLRSTTGDVIDATTALPLSVWQWMPGAVRTGGFTSSEIWHIGATLGSIRWSFAALPASHAPAPRAQRWLATSLADRQATIDDLLAIIERRVETGTADDFDRVARCTLQERQAVLPQLPRLLARLPALTAQVLHGDYSPTNLLFHDRALTAVLDFRPPDPFFLSYDLGRIAFFPDIVVGEADWPGAARDLIEGYLAERPGARPDDIGSCGRVALVQLLRSLYGVKQHYLQPGLVQDELDSFWLRRHQAVGELLSRLPETDELLQSLSSKLRSAGR